MEFTVFPLKKNQKVDNPPKYVQNPTEEEVKNQKRRIADEESAAKRIKNMEEDKEV